MSTVEQWAGEFHHPHRERLRLGAPHAGVDTLRLGVRRCTWCEQWGDWPRQSRRESRGLVLMWLGYVAAISDADVGLTSRSS